MLNNSIHKKLMVLILLISSFFLILLGSLDYYLARKTISELSEGKASISASNVSAEISSYLMQKAQYAYIISQDEQMHQFVKSLNERYPDLSDDKAYQQMLTTFKRIVIQDPDITEAYIAIQKTDRIYDSAEYENPPEYRVHTRPWYKNALMSKTLTFTTPYICPVTGKYVITASIPFYDGNGTLLGVAAVDILADKVQNIVNSLKFCESGYAFMFDNFGQVIFHPNEDYIGRSLLDNEYFSSDISEHVRAAIDGSSSYGLAVSMEQEKYMFFTPIKGVNWSIGIGVPSSEIMNPVNLLGKSSFLTIILGIVFMCLIISWWSSRFMKSINDIRHLMAEVEKGDYTLRADEYQTDELGLLGKSINRMLNKQENLLEKTTNISYKVGLAGHDLAMTIGAINTLIPIVADELNNNFFKKYRSAEAMDKFEGQIEVMQELVERLLLFDHDTRLFLIQLNNTEKKINKLAFKEDADYAVHYEEFRSEWQELNLQMGKTYNSVTKLNLEFVLLLEDLNGIYKHLSSEIVSLQEIRDKIENINSVQIESISSAQSRSLELLGYSQELLELSSYYKTSNGE